jgi:hypothetical protein
MLAGKMGVKVFTATKAKERNYLGDTLTKWIRKRPDIEILNKTITQSSDNEYHCLTITLVYSK